jgi:hypothetical protein
MIFNFISILFYLSFAKANFVNDLTFPLDFKTKFKIIIALKKLDPYEYNQAKNNFPNILEVLDNQNKSSEYFGHFKFSKTINISEFLNKSNLDKSEFTSEVFILILTDPNNLSEPSYLDLITNDLRNKDFLLNAINRIKHPQQFENPISFAEALKIYQATLNILNVKDSQLVYQIKQNFLPLFLNTTNALENNNLNFILQMLYHDFVYNHGNIFAKTNRSTHHDWIKIFSNSIYFDDFRNHFMANFNSDPEYTQNLSENLYNPMIEAFFSRPFKHEHEITFNKAVLILKYVNYAKIDSIQFIKNFLTHISNYQKANILTLEGIKVLKHLEWPESLDGSVLNASLKALERDNGIDKLVSLEILNFISTKFKENIIVQRLMANNLISNNRNISNISYNFFKDNPILDSEIRLIVAESTKIETLENRELKELINISTNLKGISSQFLTNKLQSRNNISFTVKELLAAFTVDPQFLLKLKLYDYDIYSFIKTPQELVLFLNNHKSFPQNGDIQLEDIYKNSFAYSAYYNARAMQFILSSPDIKTSNQLSQLLFDSFSMSNFAKNIFEIYLKSTQDNFELKTFEIMELKNNTQFKLGINNLFDLEFLNDAFLPILLHAIDAFSDQNRKNNIHYILSMIELDKSQFLSPDRIKNWNLWEKEILRSEHFLKIKNQFFENYSFFKNLSPWAINLFYETSENKPFQYSLTAVLTFISNKKLSTIKNKSLWFYLFEKIENLPKEQQLIVLNTLFENHIFINSSLKDTISNFIFENLFKIFHSIKSDIELKRMAIRSIFGMNLNTKQQLKIIDLLNNKDIVIHHSAIHILSNIYNPAPEIIVALKSKINLDDISQVELLRKLSINSPLKDCNLILSDLLNRL